MQQMLPRTQTVEQESLDTSVAEAWRYRDNGNGTERRTRVSSQECVSDIPGISSGISVGTENGGKHHLARSDGERAFLRGGQIKRQVFASGGEVARKDVKIVDLFSGVGGFSYGLRMALEAIGWNV